MPAPASAVERLCALPMRRPDFAQPTAFHEARGGGVELAHGALGHGDGAGGEAERVVDREAHGISDLGLPIFDWAEAELRLRIAECGVRNGERCRPRILPGGVGQWRAQDENRSGSRQKATKRTKGGFSRATQQVAAHVEVDRLRVLRGSA